MKFKINKDGILEIERAGKFKPQYCRVSGFYRTHDKTGLQPCGDNCPLFGEPEIIEILNKTKKIVNMRLCQNVELVCDFEDFKD
jgi:hypothetical protein